jgi:LCP family protein required for cell wall assembly
MFATIPKPVPEPPDPPGRPPVTPDQPPAYTKYRARPRLLSRSAEAGDGLRALRERDAAAAPAAPGTPGAPGAPGVPPAPAQPARRRLPWRRGPRGRPITPGRVAKWVALAVVGWTALALAAFLISATFHQKDVGSALDPGGVPPFSATTILVLGSDARTAKTKEPGAGGPSRSDTMLLIRVGGGHNAKLSIPRDTVVDIPGHGRNKINAAYAFGGVKLSVQTVKAYLGIAINHVVEVSFENFPALIDAMGGVDYTGGCVVSKINGGFKNGGFTLRLPAGSTHIDGAQALALARTRHNLCNPRESDLTRTRRQQKLFAAMKSRVLSPSGWLRGPFIGWNAPKSIVSDMSGPTLLGVFAAVATSGTAPTRVLEPSGAITLPDGGAGLVVSDQERRRAVHRFLSG